MPFIYTHSSGLKHDTGPGHPECPERLQTLLDLFDELGLETITAPEAETEWIARCHPMRYIEAVMEAMPDRGLAQIDADTIASPGTWIAALHAAGAVCQAVEDVLAGKTGRAFCAVRPPGHHAEPSRSMGFCLFNNVFIGALHAQTLGAQKIAIVDFDVHHGNGSDVMARAHENVFYISTHQWPLYPGTGGPGDQVPERVLNIPLPTGTNSAAFRAAYEEKAFPALEAFGPDLLMISAGFDAHKDDPLAQMDLVEDDFEWVTRGLCRIVPRAVSVLEGGYNLPALKSGVAAHLRGLAE
ncbi:MAG: histone deacetylase family protein [Micavibrio aeruginosavorus]|nr:histone deacetylase family protein [Micavibrio aeruginosavorus]